MVMSAGGRDCGWRRFGSNRSDWFMSSPGRVGLSKPWRMRIHTGRDMHPIPTRASSLSFLTLLTNMSEHTHRQIHTHTRIYIQVRSNQARKKKLSNFFPIRELTLGMSGFFLNFFKYLNKDKLSSLKPLKRSHTVWRRLLLFNEGLTPPHVPSNIPSLLFCPRLIFAAHLLFRLSIARGTIAL